MPNRKNLRVIMILVFCMEFFVMGLDVGNKDFGKAIALVFPTLLLAFSYWFAFYRYDK